MKKRYIFESPVEPRYICPTKDNCQQLMNVKAPEHYGGCYHSSPHKLTKICLDSGCPACIENKKEE